jgi:hypothetical protein
VLIKLKDVFVGYKEIVIRGKSKVVAKVEKVLKQQGPILVGRSKWK